MARGLHRIPTCHVARHVPTTRVFAWGYQDCVRLAGREAAIAHIGEAQEGEDVADGAGGASIKSHVFVQT
ncbi:MAG: hypothetical protein GWN67_16750 [Phycisphaerae bacterium]|nr:hypothetical protein [Phycisphaerae bacterium]NIP53857.1 hypothetical protein [Phycisphaerae bacterium]NIS52806.1 hypothetical protein [Phycisphaerae bacterium]NIU10218.1 hypothetical protein [Phycisphaerae bacterium]NIU57976.1 hypothetical protein [Phycisphaerae bacterium]